MLPRMNKKTSSKNPKHKETISKYFKKEVLLPENSQVQTKLNTSDDDFQSPLAKKRKGATSWKLNKKIGKTQGKRTTPKNATIEIINEDLVKSEDGLQMAIALSKSSFQSEYGCPPEEEDPETIVNPQNVKSTILERFGFQTSKQAVKREAVFTSTDLPRKIRKRFKHLTPALNLRSDQERNELIMRKIEFLLNQPEREVPILFVGALFSSKLETFMAQEKQIFCSENERFYVDFWNFPKGTFKRNHLLRDWSTIPGRDFSPERQNTPNLLPYSKSADSGLAGSSLCAADSGLAGSSLCAPSSFCRSVSPDLFDSFCESNVERKQEEDEGIIDLTGEKLSGKKRSAKFYDLEEFENDNEVLFTEKFEEKIVNSDPVTICSPPDQAKWLKETENITTTPLIILDLSSTTNVFEEFDDKTATSAFSSPDCLKSSFDLIHMDLAEVDMVEPKSSASEEHQNISSVYAHDSAKLSLSSPYLTKNHALEECDTQSTNTSLLEQYDDKVASGFFSPDCLKSSVDVINIDDVDMEKFNSSASASEPAQNMSSVHACNSSISSVLSPYPLSNHDLEEWDTDIFSLEAIDHKEKPDDICTSPKTSASRGYNSNSMNITDYVNKILNNEDYDNDSSSKNSQNFQDEELDYSSHFHMSPLKSGEISSNECMETPPNNYIIKTKNVTPMPDYETMTTPSVTKELHKVGVRPMKRVRGVKLLKYIYETTHPVMDEDAQCAKGQNKTHCEGSESIEILGDCLLEKESPEDLLFERKQSKKVASCQVPLQVVWHNFLSCNPLIRENVLLYEPLELEVLHKMITDQGFKFHIQDLISFLDKKCVTIRIAKKGGSKR